MDTILKSYESAFDIHRPYKIAGKTYPAYGFFCSHVEKYVLTRDMKMWEANSFEHTLFIETEKCTLQTISEVDSLIKEHIEPELVRKKHKYPDKNHMYSYMTFVLLSRETPDPDTHLAVKRFKFTRNYLFTVRGYSLARLIVVDAENLMVYTNNAAKPMIKTYKEILKDCEA